MNPPTPPARRSSMRLRNYDYREAGWYFVTICSHNHQAFFGAVSGGRTVLSDGGEVVARCLRSIPEHSSCVRLGPYVVMPDHVHLVLELLPSAIPDVSCPGPGRQSPFKDSLSVIIRTFKTATTLELRRRFLHPTGPVWQRGFYDRIIRNDRERFFIEQYVELNPVLWDIGHSRTLVGAQPESLARHLRMTYGLEDAVAQYLAVRIADE